MWWAYPLVALGAYMVGSIPTGVLVGKATRGIDVRNYGSGKTGFTNALRTLGWPPSLAVLLADALKGYIPAIAVWLATDSHNLQMVAALMAVTGHIWPLFAGFRGGRGVATAYGAFLAMSLPLTMILVVVAALIVIAFRYMSLMSVLTVPLGALGLLGLAIAGAGPYSHAIYGSLAATLIVIQHRGNIQRLLSGTEPKLGKGGRRRPTTS